LRKISLREIDWGDETYRSSLGRDVGPIRRSIEEVGLIIPPRLQSVQRGLRIVSGFLRLEALREMGEEECLAEMVEEGYPEAELLVESLHENLLGRGFHWAEQAWVLLRAARRWRFPHGRIMERVMPAMGLAPTREPLKRHIMVASMGESMLEELKSRGVSLSNALRLLKWPSSERPMILRLMERLHTNESILREILELTREIAIRENTTPGAVLKERKLWEVLEDEEMDRPNRTAAFRKRLKEMRFPLLSAMEESFLEVKKALGVRGDLSLQHHPHFEEPTLKVSFEAISPEDFISKCQRLHELSKREAEIERLFASIRDLPKKTDEK
jgi:hypothetical protein